MMHWHRPVLGAFEAECCCVRPGTLIERNPWTNFWHDRRCHSWRTAFYNLWIRLRAPCWFVECESTGDPR
jgi:hypothetical protein